MEPDAFGWQFPFLDVLQFRFLTVQLRKRNWREFLHESNPVAAALLSSMGYNRKERVQVKLEFLRMITRLELDAAKMKLLAVFFESYLQLKPDENDRLQRELEQTVLGKEVRVMEYLTSWEKKGLQEGLQLGKAEVALKLLEEQLDISFISKVTGLTLEDLEKLKTSTR